MLNGINVDGLNGAIAAINADARAGQAHYGVQLNWGGGTRIEAQALPMEVGGELIARDFRWTIDEPPQLLGAATGPTPQEYLMSGVAACIIVGFVVNAAVRGVEIKRLTLKMTGSLDLAGFLDLRPDASVKMAGLKYEIDVVSDGSPALLEELHERAFKFSPNAMSVENGIPISGVLNMSAF